MADTWCGVAGVVALRWRPGSADFQSRTAIQCLEPVVEQQWLRDPWHSSRLCFPVLSPLAPRGWLRRVGETDGRVDRVEVGRRTLHQLFVRAGLAGRGRLVVGEFVWL